VQPWSPDDLLAEATVVAGAVTADPAAAFAPLAEEPESNNLDFVEDHPSDGLSGFLQRLTPDERTALYRLVEAELADKVRAELAAENAQWREQQEAALRRVVERWRETQRRELEEIARHSVELAIAMAEQLLRARLAVDRAALLRALETLIYRAPRGTEFTLLAHPDDVGWLQEQEAALRALNITGIRPDRRIQPGGCLVTAEGQEWDFTVEGRFEKLAAVAREVLLSDEADPEAAAPGAADPAPDGEAP